MDANISMMDFLKQAADVAIENETDSVFFTLETSGGNVTFRLQITEFAPAKETLQ